MLYGLAAAGGVALGMFVMSLFRFGIVEAMREQHASECRNCQEKLKGFNEKFEEYSEKFNKCYGV